LESGRTSALIIPLRVDIAVYSGQRSASTVAADDLDTVIYPNIAQSSRLRSVEATVRNAGH
jgi:hypothetical protein